MADRVVIVGSGPAGLTAAAALARSCEVTVLERQPEPGGIPRHSDHTGYGLRDLRRVLAGPRYARVLVDTAMSAGAQVRTQATVTGWAGPRALEVTSPRGREVIDADAVLLATGARERPRAARMIPGERPAGIMTTAQLQETVHLLHRSVGTRAVILGTELVSWSAVLTLREAGCATVAMVTDEPRAQAPGPLTSAGRLALRVPVLTGAQVLAIEGHGRVTGVRVRERSSGRETTLACDTVITSGDWIGEYELARSRGVALAPGRRAPITDASLRLTDDGVFAAGNVVHPADQADVCALDGRHVAESISRWLAGERSVPSGVPVLPGRGMAWIAPAIWRPGETTARDRVLMWPTEHRALPQLVTEQDGQRIGHVRLPWPSAPGRVLRAPASLMSGVRADAGPVTVGLT